MRILAFSPIYLPHMGGAERTLYELFTRLAARGHEIDLIVPNLGAERLSADGGFRVFRVGRFLKRRAAKFLLYQWWQFLQARSLLRVREYDLTVFTYGLPAILLQAYLQLRRGLPCAILEFHLGTGAEISSAAENPGYIRPFLRYAYDRADAVIAISRDNARFVHEVSGRSDCVVIPQGTDPQRWHPQHRSAAVPGQFCAASEVLLLTVSRLSPRKNLMAMVEAAALLKQMSSQFKLLIIGEGEERAKLQVEIVALGLTDAVHLLGFIDERMLPVLYASADVYLSTSTYEGFGLAILEAMASRLPVVAYAAKGNEDYLVSGETGFITDHSPRSFAAAVARLVEDPVLRSRMGAKCRELIVSRYNWDRYVEEHEVVFRKVLSGRCIR